MSEPTVDGEPATGDAPSRDEWGLGNWVFYGLFGGLTLAGVAVSSGALGADVLVAPPSPPSNGSISLTVPLFVYVYATLGALGYVFTKLMAGIDRYDEVCEIGRLVEMGMRIPAAWILGAGFYLLLVQAGNDPSARPHLFATVAFLVGLYVNVAVKSLGSVADRLLGRGTRG